MADRNVVPARVYLLTFPNGKIYVGMTQHPVVMRVYRHWCDHRKGHPVGSALRKCGINNVNTDILFEGTPKEAARVEAAEIEARSARHRNVGYNIALGGFGGDIFSALSEETKKIIREGARERHARLIADPNFRQKLSQPGERNPMFGRTHSQEVREASRARMLEMRDRIFSGEAKERAIAAYSRTRRMRSRYSKEEWLQIRNELIAGAKRIEVMRKYGISATYARWLICGTHWACEKQREDGRSIRRSRQVALYQQVKSEMKLGLTIAGAMKKYGIKQTTTEKISSGKHWSCRESADGNRDS